MRKTKYGVSVDLQMDVDAAIKKTTDRLKDQGFGVLTDIDVQKTLKEKLDVDFVKYHILGACNPPLAHKALQAEEEIGLLLPCNVIVYETGEKRCRVAAIDVTAAMSVVGNEELTPVADEVAHKLAAVMTSLSEDFSDKE